MTQSGHMFAQPARTTGTMAKKARESWDNLGGGSCDTPNGG